MRTALAVVLLLLCLAPVTATPVRTLGLVVTADEATAELLKVRFIDGLMAALAPSRQWETSVLTADCALVRASGAVWPHALEPALLQQLVTSTQLDDLVAVKLRLGRESQAEVMWVRADTGRARGFRVNHTGAAEAAATGLARQVAIRLAEGFTAALELPGSVAPVAIDPSESVETTLEPAPGEPATNPVEPAGQAVRLEAAEKFLREGDLRAAEDAAQRALEAGEDPVALALLMARLAFAKGDREGQRMWLERVLVSDPTLTEARLQLAEVLRQRGLWQKALGEYQQILLADAANKHALVGSANIHADQGQPRRAADIMARAVEHYPNDAALYLRLGDLRAEYHDLAGAETAYDRAARLALEEEDKARALERLGDLYANAGRHRESLVCSLEALKLRQSGSVALAERRYQQMMATADATVWQAWQTGTGVFEGYLAATGPAREEAYAALTDLRGQAHEVNSLLDMVTPPATCKLPHAQRKLGYSLVLEAAVSGLVYLDTGRADLLERYHSGSREAEGVLADLLKPID